MGELILGITVKGKEISIYSISRVIDDFLMSWNPSIIIIGLCNN